MIISMHIPKTAGSSFFRALKEKYGERLLHEQTWAGGINPPLLLEFLAKYRYESTYSYKRGMVGHLWRRFSHQAWFQYKKFQLHKNLSEIKTRYDVVHGHFPAEKYYHLMPDAKLVCFFRDPVQQTISHYQHILRNPKRTKNPNPRRKNLNYFTHLYGYNLAQFSGLPRVAYFYDFFTDFVPFEKYAFIGITEEFDLSIRLFNAIFGTDLQAYQQNVNPKAQSFNDLCTADEQAVTRQNLRHKQQIYDSARRRFEELCKKYL